jgi:hypothetical protein
MKNRMHDDMEAAYAGNRQHTACRPAPFGSGMSGSGEGRQGMMALGFEAAIVQDPPEPVTPEMPVESLARLIS